MTTIQDLEERLNSFEQTLIQMARNNVPITEKADRASNKIPQVDENTNGVGENDGAICDVAELSDMNSMAIDDLAEIVDELLNKVEALEEGGK
jgi:hypothetical protein